MANSLFDWPASPSRFVRFDAARADDLNAALDGVSAGMDGVEVKTDAALRLPDGETAPALPAAGVRANLVIAFDENGALTTSDVLAVALGQASAATEQAVIATAGAATATASANAAAQSASAASAITGLPVFGVGDGGKSLAVNQDGTAYVLRSAFATFAYEDRAGLRATTPAADDIAIVEGLGLFVWESGSTEPDDDESCFAAASGKWLLQAVSWDLVDAWQAPDDAARDEFDEDAASKILTGSATCAITSVATFSSTSFTGTVTGATVGDRVIATPPNQLGSTAENTGRLAYHAWVSSADTVTIMLTNASGASATTNTAIRTAWQITVIKS